MPAGGTPGRGRPGDRLIVALVRAYGWPPDVVRRQTVRDIYLLYAAALDQTGAEDLEGGA